LLAQSAIGLFHQIGYDNDDDDDDDDDSRVDGGMKTSKPSWNRGE
jgi:hypothetical protein